MRVKHRPVLDVQKTEKLYSEKDGVSVKYVCTSALDSGINPLDIFYRDTPHPKFGNKYFGLYTWYPVDEYEPRVLITGADKVEELDFGMVEVDGQWHYSRHRHDFYTVGDVSIDGGRAYLRMVGNLSHPTKTFRVKNGEFVENSSL